MSVQYLNISAELGEDIRITQTRNAFDFRIKNDKTFYAVAETPAIFKYSNENLKFTLPPTMLIVITTRSVNIDHIGYRISSISVNPQMTLLEIEDAIPVLKNLIQTIDDAGWKRKEVISPKDLDRLREIFADRKSPQLNSGGDVASIGAWQDGDNSLVIFIKKEVTKDRLEEFANVLGGKAKKLKYDDLYLIEVFMDNFSIPTEREILERSKKNKNVQPML